MKIFGSAFPPLTNGRLVTTSEVSPDRKCAIYYSWDLPITWPTVGWKLFEHSLEFLMVLFISIEIFYYFSLKRESLLFLLEWYAVDGKEAGEFAFFSLFFAVIVRNKVPVSFVTGTQSRIETGKAIIGEIVPQGIEKLSAWRLGLGDTYGPMHYPGMRSLLAIACQFQPTPGFPTPHSPWPPNLPPPPPPTRFSRPSYLVPSFSFLFPPKNPAPLRSGCLTMLTTSRGGGEGK